MLKAMFRKRKVVDEVRTEETGGGVPDSLWRQEDSGMHTF